MIDCIGVHLTVSDRWFCTHPCYRTPVQNSQFEGLTAKCLYLARIDLDSKAFCLILSSELEEEQLEEGVCAGEGGNAGEEEAASALPHSLLVAETIPDAGGGVEGDFCGGRDEGGGGDGRTELRDLSRRLAGEGGGGVGEGVEVGGCAEGGLESLLKEGRKRECRRRVCSGGGRGGGGGRE